jgi:transcription-repair coupling factor (superfamily II helicase)
VNLSGPLSSLPSRISKDGVLNQLLGKKNAEVAVSEAARAFFIAGLAEISNQTPLLVVTPSANEAEILGNDLEIWLGGDRVGVFPAWETLPFERVSPGIETMGRRVDFLSRLKAGRSPDVVIAPIRALLQRLTEDTSGTEVLEVFRGGTADLSALSASFIALGYRRESQVEHRGEFAVRGGIMDIFPSTADSPIRLDLWGDEVERLTEFSVTDQRSTSEINSVIIAPAREMRPTPAIRERAKELIVSEPWGKEQWERLAEGQLFDGMESWLPWLASEELVLADLLSSEALVLLIDPKRLKDRSLDLIAEETDLARTLASTWQALDDDGNPRSFPGLHVPFERMLKKCEASVWAIDSIPTGPTQPKFETIPWETAAGSPIRLLDQVRELSISTDQRLVVAANGPGSAQRMAKTLRSESIDLRVHVTDTYDGEAGGHVVAAPLERGFIAPTLALAVLTERDITGRRRTHRSARPRSGSQRTFEDLQPGDHVVHHHHGVARYSGMEHRTLMGSERDYLVLDFKGTDKLYLPSDQIELIRPYTGGETPARSRMGGTDFAKQKARVREAVSEIAQDLVVLYQSRLNTPGYSFPADTPWMRELSDSFVFQETPDQLAAIQDVLSDMESPHPMDRLVCGDVGFGKTEVAMRAAFSAVADGKQVAVLVPTTLLAQQHHQTFVERFAAHPVRVEALSRFLTPAQQRRVLAETAKGDVDVLIGTHRLLSQDVRFKELGLLIVDEEQRFGVSHKEAIKKFKTDVDVLTLTATPIPRTLEMSLTGIRDLSLLHTAPAERLPILTHVGEYDDRAVAEAIRREVLREGQVFFVHNRVEDIAQVADQLREMVPEARIEIAHGQMDEGSLEQVVIDFWERRYDVLVCTTIIESGIDMPRVNTLVVDRADMMGLGQLHQIRGRVGRSGQRAYAYLFYPPNRTLTEKAFERLKTIGESTQLGSGFRIAMRDLEIRGAGNLLGGAQSGHIAAVGYDLYCEMVTEAVAELKGETIASSREINIDLPIRAYLPDEYVPLEELRLEAYRRLAGVTEIVEVADIEAEWIDRFGLVPAPAQTLLHTALLRAECVRLEVSDISVTNRDRVRVSPIELRQSEQVRFKRLINDGPYKGGTYKEDVKQLTLHTKSAGPNLPGELFSFLRELRPSD